MKTPAGWVTRPKKEPGRRTQAGLVNYPNLHNSTPPGNRPGIAWSHAWRFFLQTGLSLGIAGSCRESGEYYDPVYVVANHTAISPS